MYFSYLTKLIFCENLGKLPIKLIGNVWLNMNNYFHKINFSEVYKFKLYAIKFWRKMPSFLALLIVRGAPINEPCPFSYEELIKFFSFFCRRWLILCGKASMYIPGHHWLYIGKCPVTVLWDFLNLNPCAQPLPSMNLIFARSMFASCRPA